MTARELNQIQRIAKYRVTIKRQLRLAGIAFNNDDSTESLEALLLDSVKVQHGEVALIFDAHNDKNRMGKAVAAAPKVTEYSATNEWGKVYYWQSVSYIVDGLDIEAKCFVAKS
ncbi:MAG: hypothetical protein ACRC62_39330 [Microcoleus sp.]